jgi:hypothetical protein
VVYVAILRALCVLTSTQDDSAQTTFLEISQVGCELLKSLHHCGRVLISRHSDGQPTSFSGFHKDRKNRNQRWQRTSCGVRCRYQKLLANSSKQPLIDLRALNPTLPVGKPPEGGPPVLVMGAANDFLVVRSRNPSSLSLFLLGAVLLFFPFFPHSPYLFSSPYFVFLVCAKVSARC